MAATLAHRKSQSPTSAVPAYFFCSITNEIMQDPTITPCGHMFDRAAIIKWISDTSNPNAKTCPTCRSKVEEKMLAPCIPIKSAIADYLAKHPIKDVDKSKEPKLKTPLTKRISNFFKNDTKEKGDKARSHSPKSSGNEKEMSARHRSQIPPPSKKVETWATMTPLLPNFDLFECDRDEMRIGRANFCEQIFNLPEISNYHALIYAKSGEDGLHFFIEDKSTNGVFVNGSRVGKGVIANIVNGDEISFGERFATRFIPHLSKFIDWAFAGVRLEPTMRREVEMVKEIGDFLEYVKMTEADLKNKGIFSEEILSRLLGASSSWLEKYRFPAFRFDVVGMPPKVRIYHNPSESADLRRNSRRLSVLGNVANQNGPPVTELDPNTAALINFEPSSYSEFASKGHVQLVVRRSQCMTGVVSVFIRTNDRGTAKSGRDYQEFERVITFGENEVVQTVDFTWTPNAEMKSVQTIHFSLMVLNGDALPGNDSDALLVLQSNHGKQDDAYYNDDEELYEDLDENFAAPFNSVPHKTPIDDDLVSKMIDQYPFISHQELVQVIEEQRQLLMPLEDPLLLQDMVSIKLTAMSIGSAPVSRRNSKISRAASPDRRKSEIFNDVIDGHSGKAIKTNPAMALPVLQPETTSNTITRIELDNFLIMAALTLVRKYQISYNLESTRTHCPSSSIHLARKFAETFIRTNTETKAVDLNSEMFTCEAVIGEFKKTISMTPEEIKAFLVRSPEVAANSSPGYKYHVVNQKSPNHQFIQNNHVVIEDLNTFAHIKDAPFQSFYAVYDGHGGAAISEYLMLHLALNIARSPLFVKNATEAIKAGYLRTDDAILKKASRDKVKGGSSAITAIIRENLVYVSWVGDCRCVMFYQSAANGPLDGKSINTPHRPIQTEKERVQAAGGTVQHVGGKWRVNGILPVTRAFGDDSYKPMVIAEPETIKLKLTGYEKFLLICCDGIFEVLKLDEITEMISAWTKEGVSSTKYGNDIVKEAIQRGCSEDITVIFIDLTTK